MSNPVMDLSYEGEPAQHDSHVFWHYLNEMPEHTCSIPCNMPYQRWLDLMAYDDLPLTQSEMAEHWHFCADWDGLLVGPGMMEMEHCQCYREDSK